MLIDYMIAFDGKLDMGWINVRRKVLIIRYMTNLEFACAESNHAYTEATTLFADRAAP